MLGGSWSAYCYNGHIYSSDTTQGFDVLTISGPLTDPAADVQMDDVQTQPMYRGGN